jgi:hypothetical protein
MYVRRFAIIATLIAATAIAIVVAKHMADDETIKVDTLRYELGTRVADAGLATGIGALVGLLVWLFQQEQAAAQQRVDAAREKLAARHQWLREFAIELTGAYTDIKQARRRLQWQADPDLTGLPSAAYERQLRALDRIQARFEVLEAMAATTLVNDDRRSDVAAKVSEIGDALSGLVTERKGKRSTGQARWRLKELPKMRAFLARSSEDPNDELGKLFDSALGFRRVKKAYKGAFTGILSELQDESVRPSRARPESPRGNEPHGLPASPPTR